MVRITLQPSLIVSYVMYCAIGKRYKSFMNPSVHIALLYGLSKKFSVVSSSLAEISIFSYQNYIRSRCTLCSPLMYNRLNFIYIYNFAFFELYDKIENNNLHKILSLQQKWINQPTWLGFDSYRKTNCLDKKSNKGKP